MSTRQCNSVLAVGLIWGGCLNAVDFFPPFPPHCDRTRFYLTVYVYMCSSFHHIGMKRNIQHMMSLLPKQRKTVPKNNFFRGNQVVLFFFKVEQETTLNIWYFYTFYGAILDGLQFFVLFCFFTGLYVLFVCFLRKMEKQGLLVNFRIQGAFLYKIYFFVPALECFLKHPPYKFYLCGIGSGTLF